MKFTLRTLYALIVLSVMFILAMSPFREVEAATAGPAIAAGQRAMNHMTAEQVAWLRTLGPKDQQIVLCTHLAVLNDTIGLPELDCYTVNDHLTHAKSVDLAESFRRYDAMFGYVTPTDNDMARIPAGNRADVRKGIACRHIRDKIEAQVFLMKSGSTGYWNMEQMRVVERQQCGDTLAVAT